MSGGMSLGSESGEHGKRRVIGIDLGGTKLAGGVVSEDLVVHHRAHRFSRGADQQAVLDRLVEVVEELRVQNGDEQPIEAVGLGIPCLIDQASGSAVMAVNLPLEDVPIRDLMSERLGLPVMIDNDANVAALAEQRFGAGKGKRDVVLLTLGTGVGGGIVLDGKVFRGSSGAGAELGHIVVDADGPRCQGSCPNHGCLETFVSGTALARDALALATAKPDSQLGKLLAEGRDISGVLITELAFDGDADAIEILREAGEYLGVGITSLVNIFNPEVVVVGGGAAAAGDLLLKPAREVLATRGLRPSRDQAQIVPAHFGAEAGMLGAAVLAMDACFADGAPTETH
ncbi:MAG: ROK family protein [Thermoleophilaceae bacterium]|nr:ROK family protein [Thermoleophilaceae bacterium]